MKNTFKMVWHLAKPELKVSWGVYINLFLFYSLYTLLFVKVFDGPSESKIAIFDLLFLLLFVFGPTWFKPKGHQYQKLGNSTWGSPAVIMNLHLPVSKKVIVWKTVFTYILGSLPFQLYMLLMWYWFNPTLREMLEPENYFAFILIWLSFGIYAGLCVLYAEVWVYKMPPGKMHYVLSILSLLVPIVLIIFFPTIFQKSILDWSMVIAGKWALASSVISVLLAIFGLYYWSRKMAYQLSKVDYL